MLEDLWVWLTSPPESTAELFCIVFFTYVFFGFLAFNIEKVIDRRLATKEDGS